MSDPFDQALEGLKPRRLPSLPGGPSFSPPAAPAVAEPSEEEELGWLEARGTDVIQRATRQAQFLSEHKDDPRAPGAGKEDLPERAQLALWLAHELDIDPSTAYENLDVLIGQVAGEQASPQRVWRAVQNAWRTGWITNRLGLLAWEKNMGASGARLQTIDAEIEQLQAEIPPEDPMAGRVLANTLRWVAGSLPLMIQGGIKGAQAGLLTAGAAMLAAGAAGAPVLAAGAATGVGAPSAVTTVGLQMLSSGIYAFGVGAKVGASLEMSKIMGGLARMEIEKIRDREGRPLSPVALATLSITIGLFQGLLENMQFETVLRAYPGFQKILGEGVEQVVKDTVLKTVGNRGVKAAARWGVDALTEGFEEGAQEIVGRMGENLANYLLNHEQARLFDYHSAREVAESVRENFVAGTLAGGAMVLPGHVFSPFVQARVQKIDAQRHAAWQRYELAQARLQQALDHREVSDRPAAVDPSTVRQESVAPLEAGEERVLEEAPEPEVRPTTLEEELAQQVHDPAWQHTQEEWERIEELRQRVVEGLGEETVSAYKDAFSPEMYEIRRLISTAAPRFSWQQVEGAALLIDVIAQAQGVSTLDFARSVFAPGIFAGPHEIAQLHERATEEARQRALSEAASPEEAEKAARLVAKKVAAAQGVTEFLEDGRALVYLLKSADFSTWVHEVGHILRRRLPNTLMRKAAAWAGADPDNPVWPEEAEEKFADGLVEYLRSGIAPNPEVRRVFQKIAEWLEYIYKAVRDRWALSPEIREVYDAIFSGRRVGEGGAELLRLDPNPRPVDQLDMAFRIETPAPEAIENNPAKVPDDQFVPMSEYQGRIRDVYLDELGNQRAVLDKDGRQVPISSRTTPLPEMDLREGMWMIDDTWRGIHGHEIAQLRRFDPRAAVYAWDDPQPGQLALGENLVQQNIQGRAWDAERYAGWLDQGLTPPPISVVEHQNGYFTVTDGHRRVEAARMRGVPVFAWVWPATDGPEGRRVGLTFELAKGREYEPGRIDKYLFQVDPKKQKKIIDALVAELGITTDPMEAGYILPDGRMLDYSGVKQGYGDSHGVKRLAHEYMPRLLQKMYYAENPDPGRTIMQEARSWIIGNGGLVRMDAIRGTFSLSVAPTAEQLDTIRRILPRIRKALREEQHVDAIYIDFVDQTGRGVLSGTFPRANYPQLKEWLQAQVVYQKPLSRLFQTDPRLEQKIQQVNKELKEFFGTTTDLHKAAYVLVDGSLLNFDNRWGATRSEMQGGRMVHRLVGKVPTLQVVDAVNQTLRNAVIRMDYDERFTILQTMYQPRPEQWPALRRVAENTERIMIEYVDRRTGSMLAFEEIDFPRERTLRAFFARAKRVDPAFLFQTDPFVLRSVDVVTQKVQNNMSGEQILRTLANNRVTADELHWTGLDEFLEPATKYRKEEVLAYLAEHAVKLEEFLYGAPEQQITELPPGTERVEMSATQASLVMPGGGWSIPVRWSPEGGLDWQDAERRALLWLNEQGRSGPPQYSGETWQSPYGENYREIVFRLPWKHRDWTIEGPATLANEPIPGREQVVREAQRRYAELADEYTEAMNSLPREEWLVRRDEIDSQMDRQTAIMEQNTRPVMQPLGQLGGETEPMLQILDWPYRDPERSHFREHTNVIGWIRTQDYEREGRKVLLVDEYQSEWAERAREEGFSDPAALRQVLRSLQTRVLDLREEIAQKAARRSAAEERWNELLAKLEQGKGEQEDWALTGTLGAEVRSLTKQIDDLTAEIDRNIDNARRMVRAEDRISPAPFIASRRWGIKIKGEEWRNEEGQTQRFTTPEEAERFLSKRKDELPTAVVADLGYLENTAAWASHLFKRALRFAVEHGYDRMAWTDGATQNKRWSLRHVTDEIQVQREKDGTYTWTAYKDENVVTHRDHVEGQQLRGQIGRHIAETVLSGEGAHFGDVETLALNRGLGVEVVSWAETEAGVTANWYIRYEDGTLFGVWNTQADAESEMKRVNEWVTGLRELRQQGRGTHWSFTGLDLEIGGEFMLLVYDKLVVNFAQKYTKQWGATVGQEKWKQPGYEVAPAPAQTGRWAINLNPQAGVPRWVLKGDLATWESEKELLAREGYADQKVVFSSREGAEAFARVHLDPEAVREQTRYMVKRLPHGSVVSYYASFEEADRAIADNLDRFREYHEEGPRFAVIDRKVAALYYVGGTNIGEPIDRYVLVDRAMAQDVQGPGGEIEYFDNEAQAWQWAAENAEYLLDLAEQGQRVWYIEITDAMRAGVKDGIFQQFLFQVSEHEDQVHQAVVRGDPVPQDVVEQYKEREWAAEELAARQKLAEEARSHEFRDLEEFVLFHQTMSVEEPKSPEYYALIWELAGGDLNVSGEEGFTAVPPAEANRRFLKRLNTPEGFQAWIGMIGAATYTESARKGQERGRGVKAGWERFPGAVRNAGIEVARQGFLTVPTWKAALAVVKADVEFYREATAAATEDPELILQLQAERDMPPAEETRLRRENERLRRELKVMREWEKDVIAQSARGKQPWQLTKREWVASWPREERKPWDFMDRHKRIVQEAVEQDLPVPPEVLADYRDARKLYEQRRAEGIPVQEIQVPPQEEGAPAAEVEVEVTEELEARGRAISEEQRQKDIERAPKTAEGKPANEHGVYLDPSESVGQERKAWSAQLYLVHLETGQWLYGYSFTIGPYSGASGPAAAWSERFATREEALRAGLAHGRQFFEREQQTKSAQAAQKQALKWIDAELAKIAQPEAGAAVAAARPEATDLTRWDEQRRILERDRADLEHQVVHWAQRAAVEQRFGQVYQRKREELAKVEKRLAVAAIREQTRERLARAKEEHKAVRERARQRRAEQRQRERQKRIIGRLRAIYARLPHMDQKAAEPIRGILEGIELTYRGQKAILEVQKLRAELADEEMEFAGDELEKLGLLDKRNIMELSAEEFEQVWKAVQHWVSFNADLQSMRVMGEQWRHEKAVEQATFEMKQVKEVEEELVRLAPGLAEAAKQKGTTLWDELLGIGQTQYVLIVEQLAGTNSVIFDILSRQIEDGRRKQLELFQKYEDFFRTEIGKIGIPNPAQWLHEETQFRLGRRRIALRRGEKLAMYMMSLDEDARESMLKAGIGSRRRSALRTHPLKISEDLLNDIAASISDPERQFVEVVQALFETTWVDMNPVYEQRYGHPMQRIPNWYHKDVMPIGRGSTVEEQKALEDYRRKKLRPGVPHGRIKERQGVVVPLFVNSIEHDVFEAINYASRYAGLEIPVYQASKLLGDRDFASELARRYGERTLKHLKQGVRDVVAEAEALSTIENFFAKTRSMIQIGYLSFNPFSMLKIFMGFANSLVYLDMDHLARGFAEYFTHMRSIEERNKALSPYYRDRIARGFTRDIAEGLRSMREGALVAARRKLPEIGMRPIQFADRLAVSPVMHAAVLQALDDFQRGELSEGTQKGIGYALKGRDPRSLAPGEKIELAYRFADFVIQRTQDQRLPEYRSALSRASQAGGFVKFFTMFGSNTNTNLNIMRRAITEYQRSARTGRDVSRFTRIMLLSVVVVPMAEAFVNAMRNYLLKRYDEDENKLLSMLSDYLRNVGGLWYFVRDVADAAIGAIQGRSREFTIPPIQLTNDAFRLIQKGVGLAKEKDVVKRERRMWSFFDSLLEFILMIAEIPLVMPKRYIQEVIRKSKE